MYHLGFNKRFDLSTEKIFCIQPRTREIKVSVVVPILSHRHHNKLVQSTGFRYRGKLFELKSWLKPLNTAYSNKLLEILLLQIITRDKSVRRPRKAAERQSHEQR